MADNAIPEDELRQLVRAIGKEYDRKYWLDCAARKEFPREMFRAMADADLLGLDAPVEYGGMGQGLTAQAIVCEELGANGTPMLNLFLTVFSRQVLLRHAREVQKQRFVTPAIRGEKIFSFATTEAEAGTNTFRNKTVARRTDDGYVINGEKVYISSADEGHYMMLVCRTSPYDESDPSTHHDVSLFVIEPHALDGITMDEMRIALTIPERQFIVRFDDVHVPADALIGEEGNGLRYLFDAVNPERILASAQAVGTGRHVLAKAVEYAKHRAPFGTPLGSYQALSHPMAQVAAELEAAKLITYRAARLFDEGGQAGPETQMAKLLSAQASLKACECAITVHGGAAFDVESDVLAFWPTQRLFQVAPINNEQVLNYLAEKYLGLPRNR